MAVALNYTEHLYQKDLEGYLQLAHIPSDTHSFKGAYLTGQAAAGALCEVEGRADYYITPNSYYIAQRASGNIRHLRALYSDLDLVDYGKMEAVYEVAVMVGEGEIPEPTMITDSGRGLHLYWRINHAPMGALWTWQQLQDYLYRKLRHLGADAGATDSARLLRVPGTINSRNGALCKPVVITNKIYSMYDLRDKYLPQPKPKAKPRRKAGGKVAHIFNPYTLHRARLNDLLTLCKLRNYEVTGHRNNILHLYAYWQGITMRDMGEMGQAVHTLNDSFKEPLPRPQVDAVARCVPKAIQGFLAADGGPTTGYNYTNERLIEILKIDEDEQQELSTIIGKKEKYRRNNERRRQARRNEDGLTARQQQAQDMQDTITTLRAKGLTIAETADIVGLTMDGVRYYLYRR